MLISILDFEFSSKLNSLEKSLVTLDTSDQVYATLCRPLVLGSFLSLIRVLFEQETGHKSKLLFTVGQLKETNSSELSTVQGNTMHSFTNDPSGKLIKCLSQNV